MRAHVLEQVLGLDRLDHRLDDGAGHRAAAEGGAERIELDRAAATRGDISSAAHGKPLPSALAVVIMSGCTP